MTDNPNYGGQGRPGDEYHDDQYSRPRRIRAGAPAMSDAPRVHSLNRATPEHEQGGYPPPRQGYPEQGGYPDQGYYLPATSSVRPVRARLWRPGYDQGWPALQGIYGARSTGLRPVAVRPRPRPRPVTTTTDASPGRHEGLELRAVTNSSDRHLLPATNSPATALATVVPEYGQPDYGRYDQAGYPPAPTAPEYDYGQPEPAGYGSAVGGAVTLQLDDGSGRTYQLREGANVIGRGQTHSSGCLICASPPPPGDPLGRPHGHVAGPELHQRHHREQRAGSGVAPLPMGM